MTNIDVENLICVLTLEQPTFLFTPTYQDFNGLSFGFYDISKSSCAGHVMFKFGCDSKVGAARDPAIQFKTDSMDCAYVISYDHCFAIPGRPKTNTMFYKAYTFLKNMPKRESGLSADEARRQWELFTSNYGNLNLALVCSPGCNEGQHL